MPKRCAYGWCNSDSRYPERSPGIRFIPFPKPKRRLADCWTWIQACGRPPHQLNPDRITKDTYLCTKHFHDPAGPTEAFPNPIPFDKNKAQQSRRSRRIRAKPRSEADIPQQVQNMEMLKEQVLKETDSDTDSASEPDERLEPPGVGKKRCNVQCVAFGCSNTYASDPKLSFHIFPDPEKKPAKYDAWVAAVRTTRTDWKGPPCKKLHPAAFKSCVLCSNHFKEYCFINTLQISMGFQQVPRLATDAIPTIFSSLLREKKPIKRGTQNSRKSLTRVRIVKRKTILLKETGNSRAKLSDQSTRRSHCQPKYEDKGVQVEPDTADFACQFGESYVKKSNHRTVTKFGGNVRF